MGVFNLWEWRISWWFPDRVQGKVACDQPGSNRWIWSAAWEGLHAWDPRCWLMLSQSFCLHQTCFVLHPILLNHQHVCLPGLLLPCFLPCKIWCPPALPLPSYAHSISPEVEKPSTKWPLSHQISLYSPPIPLLSPLNKPPSQFSCLEKAPCFFSPPPPFVQCFPLLPLASNTLLFPHPSALL